MYSEYSFKKSIQEVNKQRIDKLLLTKLYANHFPIELRRNTEALIHTETEQFGHRYGASQNSA